ncbi:MAG: NifB/NifX family molybdenum-iron cluster-binding protein [Ignavibacteriales bacterium]|nr:NifB/NifX family molybdenum-iron cluster-binding protein [Ignavibacteriales bacterium]MCF8314969.1 NifB/NifX family molybdenum-iron cluster-binding protein [Ignavibacteriales bacterium]MCF8436082.1 NifB/NifX family molybdenum-iron cluster-binding protein [Ignavibacteriales bacterium]
MKIAIPVLNPDGFDSKVNGHFGSSPYFALFDSGNESLTFIPNENNHHEHGKCTPVGSLIDHDVEAVITRGMGMRAISNLQNIGIKVFYSTSGATLNEMVTDIKAGNFVEMRAEDACSHHGGGHGDHNHEHGHDHHHGHGHDHHHRHGQNN